MSGKAAGAALKIAAPEAAVASKVAGGAKPKPAAGSAADHKAKIDAIKARRPVEHEDQGDEHGDEHGDQGDEQGDEQRAGGMTAGSTGGGFVLGVMVWALVRAYIGNPGQPSGPDGVRRLLKAKFLNKTS